MKIESYRDLRIWQKAMDFVVICYRLSETFPSRELYALSSRLWRAAVSVPSNIAEGNGRGSVNEYLHFLNIARGSLKECETQLMIAERLSYIDEEQLKNALQCTDEMGRMLTNLMRNIRK